MSRPEIQTQCKPAGLVRRFARASSGVSAVEFALIAPLMILLFFGLGELGQGLMAQRRTSHIASTIGDLSAQATTLHQSDITDIFSVANIMMAPLPTSTLKMRITSITAGNDANKTPKVDWSKGQGLSDLGTGTTVTVPVGLLTASGDSVIMAESTYSYASPVGVVLPHGLNFSETFYFRPRKSTNVTYSP